MTALWADQLEENQGSSYTRLNVFRTWTAVIRYILYANLRSSKNRNLIFDFTNSILIYPGPENHFNFNSVQKETILFLNQKWVSEFDRRYFEWMSVVDLRSSPIARKYETSQRLHAGIWMQYTCIIGGMFKERIVAYLINLQLFNLCIIFYLGKCIMMK